MKNRPLFIAALMLLIACAPGLWAQSYGTLKARVGALYNKADRMLETKDLDGFLSLLTDDYQPIFAGTDREGIRSMLKVRFMGFSELRAEHTILEITQSGNVTKVINEQKLEGKSGETWRLISQSTVMDLLIQEDDSLKFSRSCEIDRSRLSNIVDQTYKDGKMSFRVPENWIIIPVSHPTTQDTVIVLASDRTSAGVLAHLKVSNISAQQAAEGDEAVGKVLSKEGTYKLFKSGALLVNGYEGYEIESQFFIPFDRERHRRRVYFVAAGDLYPLCFDAIPLSQWDQVKDGFQSVLDSFRVQE